eukprot:CAMPEP_0181475766 /NCGR_PEP_ID=MMETSP1110-20121109/41357_1 /TAXON_ID=174948 /ORGANISM="Symbiodinium sp., Strain CCMP421" /LENGTH=213 /DNA_ID=CAMNT_0023601021 /DNA_START=51 /DNA_END=693 /DNA_ORIENTATION=+
MLSGSVIILVFLGGLPFTQGGCLSENQDSLGSCAKKCTGDAARAACVSDCLIDLDVPYTCATCLGTQYDCGRRFCRTDCSGNSSTCATCIDSLCSSCIKALNFPSKAAKAGPSLTQLFMVAEGDFGGKEEEGPVSLLAQAAGTCESGGDVVEIAAPPAMAMRTHPAAMPAAPSMPVSAHARVACRRVASSLAGDPWEAMSVRLASMASAMAAL